ncbi:23S rRNA (uracil(1939)-C(5))-methyltransferase RlmD [Flagellatimonas centrodinii]|uniref:23S rRNA (uracil(1939)-C(5))-methyltransferase RlmD n=1 Tax=Flagellatimonas centrodinii TaxID=2806210 RepID=UPI001FF73667|nr:23S rRNA (uracil(1939)-C(5))-methyltransferase RlmD [Flagellatimonas centrodinii]ULQ46565.1 23S rRNA (uracil(1939)-C(5))-methyltransferase RlmD [Flagellatimonas centrodinii]
MRRRNRRPPEGEFLAEVVDLAEDGRGVARLDGKVVFIADSLPGERVRFRYVDTGRAADEGQTVAVEVASPDRVEPGCAHFGLCGGCALQHLAPEAQIRFKQKQMLDALARIGQVTPEAVAPPITGPVWGYRRRARIGVKKVPKKGGVLVGFRERRSHFLAQLQSCPVLDPRVGERLRVLADAFARMSIADRIPQIEMAAADHVCLAVRVLAPPSEEDLAILRQLALDTGLEIRLQPGGLDSITPLTPPAQVLDYSPDGSDLRLQFRPADFIQVNGFISQRVVNQAIEWLAPRAGERILELFCGLGNFSLPLARHGVELVAVEGDTGLVQRARDNAARAGLTVRFEKADLFTSGADADWLAGDFDRVLLDPPRSGAEAMMPLIAAKQPRSIVYVSCHPGTLARDAGTLVRDHGYRLTRAGVMDMFPHTAHVESMALFERL